MQTTHIIFAGCSFSDEGVFQDDFDLTSLKNEISYSSLRCFNTIKLHKYFALDLINQNKSDNIKIHTIGRGSYGNHVIFDKLQKKVIELQSNSNNKIYAVIQLSALIRPNGLMNQLDVDINKYPYDYLPEYPNDYESVQNIFVKHIDNIHNIHNFCKKNNIINTIFFGWANLFMEDFIEYDIVDKIDNLKKIVNFYEYKESIDEMESYCAGKKSKINHNTIDDMLTYKTPPGEFGGITEFGRSNLPIGKRYNLITDAHPSSNSYYVFYQNILKKWFIENGILLNESYNQNYEILLNNIFNFEYIKFMNTLSVPQNQNEKVSKLAYNVVYENKIEDVDYMIKKFKEINNNL
jgi:hypothetical protein